MPEYDTVILLCIPQYNILYTQIMQIEVLEESKMMIPDCKRRLKTAYEDLKNILVSREHFVLQQLISPYKWQSASTLQSNLLVILLFV